MKKIYFVCSMFLLLSFALYSGCAYTPSDSLTSSSEFISEDFTLSSDSTSSSVASINPTSYSVLMPKEHDISDSNGRYTYDENSRMTGYYIAMENRPKNISESDFLSQEELHHLGEEYLKDKIPLEQYVFSGTRDDPYRQEIEFQYHKVKNSYECFDFADVTVAYDGTIISFYAPRVGIFDNIIVPEIDRSKLLDRLNVMAKERLGDTPYDIQDSWLLILREDGTPAMQMIVWPNGEEMYNEFFSVPIE